MSQHIHIGQEALMEAAWEGGYLTVLTLLRSDGANVHLANGDGDTALHYAALRGHHSVVDLLLNRDANANRVNRDGDTPLHYAALQDHHSVVELLLNHGATANLINGDGDYVTPSGVLCVANL